MLAATLTFENQLTLDQPIDTEVELVRAVAKGDKKAFEQLFRQYHDRVFRFSIRMLKDDLLADEVACDTLYAVWKSATRFREQSAVSTWILGIAYRRALKSYNQNAKHTKRREPVSELEAIAESSPAVNPEAQMNASMQMDQLEVALSTLSSNHRAVMELIALGYSVSEIAEIVDCPENTVKTRTFHARRQLKSAIEECS